MRPCSHIRHSKAQAASQYPIVGVTEPHWVMVGGNTDCPLKVWRPGGALVLAGDAGGMFDLCIGTDRDS
jgi:hypothetical protein